MIEEDLKHGDSLTISFPLAINPDLKTTITSYYHISDIITALGGIKSAFSVPLIFIFPLTVLYFLYSLAGIIKETYTTTYKNQLMLSLTEF
mgnify:CR=1 FL=1